VNSFFDTMKQLGPTRLGLMAGILVGLLLFFVFVSLRITSPDMKLLYTDLSNIDSGAIAAKLEESEIPYEMSPDGSRITVPENDVGRARMLLASEGLPNGGSMGYEIFDEQSGFGTTNFVQNINQVRALEGELARTIASVETIRSARVHIVLPQRELFSREQRTSTASVFLGVRPGAVIEREQIAAIQSLVASGVPDLKASEVSIIDSNGNLLAKGGTEDVNLMTMKAEEMRRNYEANLTQKIEDQVSRIVGFGKVRATVTADINFDRIQTNEELFDPESQVVRSSQTTEENNLEREPPPEDVSVENQLPGVGADILAGDQPSLESNRTEEVTNFEISKTMKSTIREVGEINRMSVAVLVDGKYVPQPVPEDAKKGTKPEILYEARTAEEMEQIKTLIRSAVGFDEDRGDTLEVVNMPFAEIEVEEEFVDERFLFGFEKGDLIDMAEIMTVAVMIILVVLLILQPMVSRLMAVDKNKIDDQLEADLLAARPSNPALAGPSEDDFRPPEDVIEESLINIAGVEGKVKASSIKKVEEIVDNYPAETVSVIRSWMTQEG
jgi:flagellar M-ring protein FliF